MAQKDEKDFKLEVQQDGEKEQRSDAGEWIPRFLTALRATSNVYLSCREAGISRKTAYQLKDVNEEFAAEWNDAHQDGLDLLEYTLRRRAMQSSDKLGQFLLEVHRYGRKQQLEHSGPGGAPIPVAGNVVVIMDEDDDEEESK